MRDEQIVWLVTLAPDQTPEPSPVWFLWDDGGILLFSQPNTSKVRNIERQPRVALHLDSDGRGGDIVVLTGDARIAPDHPPIDQVAAYVDKYRAGITGIGFTPEAMAQTYSTAIRMTPTNLRGH